METIGCWLALALVIGPFIFLFGWLYRRQEQAWRMLAERTGLTYQSSPFGFVGVPGRITGLYKGRALDFGFSNDRGGNSLIQLSLNNPIVSHIKFSNAGLTTFVGLLPSREVQRVDIRIGAALKQRMLQAPCKFEGEATGRTLALRGSSLLNQIEDAQYLFDLASDIAEVVENLRIEDIYPAGQA